MSWLESADYDKWRTTPPEEKPSKLVCSGCDSYIYPYEKVYRLDGGVFCEDCAEEWLSNQYELATEEECFEF